MALVKAPLATALLLSLSSIIAPAQDLYRLQFSGYKRLLNIGGVLTQRKLTSKDLITRCVGGNAATNGQFTLAYNATDDTIVVANTNGSQVCEVFQFLGGVTNTDGRRIDRLTYLFFPDQSNAVGSGVLSQRIKNSPKRYYISGRLQFAMGTPIADTDTDTNSPPATNSITTPTNTVTPGTNGTPTNTNGTGLVITTNGTPAIPDSSSTNLAAGNVSSNAASGALNPPPLPTVAASSATPGAVAPSAQSSPIALATTKATLAGVTSTNVPAADLSADDLLRLNLTNVQICVGTFSGGRRLFAPGSTNGP